jgi:hypothetical protein
MIDEPATPVTRREFARVLLRSAAMGGVTLVTAALVMRRPNGPMREEPCRNRGNCGRCQLAGGCGLPAALSYRAAGENERG